MPYNYLTPEAENDIKERASPGLSDLSNFFKNLPAGAAVTNSMGITTVPPEAVKASNPELLEQLSALFIKPDGTPNYTNVMAMTLDGYSTYASRRSDTITKAIPDDIANAVPTGCIETPAGRVMFY